MCKNRRDDMAELKSLLQQLEISHYHSALGFNGVNTVEELAQLKRVDMQVRRFGIQYTDKTGDWVGLTSYCGYRSSSR